MKKSFIAIFLAVLLSHLTALPLYCLPEGQSVESGNVTFEQPNPSTLNITASDKAVINFNSFSIAQNETVNFIQPSSSSTVLSRVTGGQASNISGSLTANGILFLVNSEGIKFSPTANVQVNSLIASTLDISTNNFISSNYALVHNPGSAYAQVLNQGRITGDNIALIGSSAVNTGVIVGRVGTVHLASGDKTTVSFDSRGLIQVEITEKTSGRVLDLEGQSVKDAVANSGTIEAKEVVMSAKTASDLFENAVNQAGIVRATGLTEKNGIIIINSNENIQASGQLEAGKVTIESFKDVIVKSNLSATGDLELLADNDFDGIGAFKQAKATFISTANAGDILIQASGDCTLANIDSSGSLNLQQAGAPATFTQCPDSVIVTQGSLIIGKGVTINAANTQYNIGKDWINQGVFIPQISKVSLVSALEAKVTGSNTFYDFTIAVPGKIVKFDSDGTQAIIGTLTLKGEYGKLLVLQSIEPPKQWKINPQGITDIQYCLIGNSINIRGPPLKAIHSSSLGNLSNWDLDPYWVGAGADNNWSTEANWDTGTVPTQFDTLTFDGLTGLNPNKDSFLDPAFQGTIDNLILNGYSGTLTLGRDLTLKGDFNRQSGTFNPATYTVSFIDSSKPSNVLGNNTFYNFTCLTPEKIIRFEAGATQTILGLFKIEGAFTRHVKLISTQPGDRWQIDPSGPRDLIYAWIEDSYNVNPAEIVMTKSTDRGNSIGWDPTVTWIGPAGGTWSTDANWSSGADPGAGDDVVFDGTANTNSTVDSSFAGTIGSLSLNSGYTAQVTMARTLTTTTASGCNGNVTVNSGTLTLSTYTLTVAGTLSVAGGTLTASSGNIDANGDVSLSSGTLTAPASGKSFTVFGSWTKSGGTFTPGTGTVTFDATTTGKSITDGSSNFYNLTFNSSGGWSFADSTIIDNDLTVTLGTLSGTNDITVNGGDATGNGSINLTSGTFLLDASGNFGGNTNWSFYNLTFGGSGTSTISGSNTFYNLTSTAAGKTLTFTRGTTQTATNALTLTGTAANPIVINDIGAGAVPRLILQSGGTQSISNVYVTNNDASGGLQLVARGSSTLSGTTTNWILGSTGTTFTWTGAVSTDWNTATNWDLGIVPSSTDTIIIPNTVNKPILAGAVNIAHLTINAGETLYTNGNALTVTGDMVLNGTLNTVSSTITIGGNLTGSGDTIVGLSPVVSVTGYIGTLNNPIGFNVTGTLNIHAGCMQDKVSIALRGSGNISWSGSMPGFVFVNNNLQPFIGQQSFRTSLEQGESGLYNGANLLQPAVAPVYMPALAMIAVAPGMAPVMVPVPAPAVMPAPAVVPIPPVPVKVPLVPRVTPETFSGVSASIRLPERISFANIRGSSIMPQPVTRELFSGITSMANLPVTLTAKSFSSAFSRAILPAAPVKPSFEGVASQAMLPALTRPVLLKEPIGQISIKLMFPGGGNIVTSYGVGAPLGVEKPILEPNIRREKKPY